MSWDYLIDVPGYSEIEEKMSDRLVPWQKGIKGAVSLPVEPRFWANVEKTDTCWNWIGSSAQGYGVISVNGKNKRSHRISLEWALGRALEPGEWALHKCDNPACVNPEHLFVGDRKTNMQDASQKGRLEGIHRKPLTKKRPLREACLRGHLYTLDNTYFSPDGRRICKTCRSGYVRRFKDKS